MHVYVLIHIGIEERSDNIKLLYQILNQPSQSANLGADSSVGSSVRQVVIHRTSMGPRPF